MNRSVIPTRLRLTALWFAVFAHALAETAVRTYAIFKPGDGGREENLGFLFILLGFSAAPAFALAPLIGTIACGRGRWPIMVAATFAGLAAAGWSAFSHERPGAAFCPICLGVMALETAFFAVCAFAIIPEASRAGRVWLPQLNGLFVAAIGAGIFAGQWIAIELFAQATSGMPVPLQFGIAGYGLALVCILFARFQPDNPTRFNDGLIGPFTRTSLAIFRDRLGRNSLLTLWGAFAIGFAVEQSLLTPLGPEMRYGFFASLIVGLVIGGWHFHPFRTLGIVPFSSIGLAICALWGVASGDWHDPAIGIACCLGLTAAPLLTIYQINQPESQRGHGGALLLGGWAFITGLFLIPLLGSLRDPGALRPLVGQGVLGLSLLGMIALWVVFFRAAVQWLIEWLLVPMYRIKSFGPGVEQLPWKGPVLVIANHAAWFDPIWLEKIVPFAPTPMMTSRFFDLPIFGWFVRKVVGAIRVPDVKIRKDAPEIHDVIAALDRRECLFVFPEGWLRRKEDVELRRFGRGIWQILKARPDVPIFACWIDGNWGSFFSHRGGPPMKNKRIDFMRPIRIAVAEPFKVDEATLATHMATRTMLMKKVLEARTLLGLPPIDPFTLPAADDDAADKPVEGAAEGAT